MKELRKIAVGTAVLAMLCSGLFTETGIFSQQEAIAVSSDSPLHEQVGETIGTFQTYDENDPFLTGTYNGLTYDLITPYAWAYHSTGLIEVTVTTTTYYMISDCETSDEIVEIPDEINGYPVQRIGDSAFADCSSITALTIPDTIEWIGTRAFENCSSLKEITIPDSVTEIGGTAFIGCSALESVQLPSQITSLPNDGKYGFFENCTSLKQITIPDTVTEIGYAAFYNCDSLTHVTMPDSVTFIDGWTFSECDALVSVSLPEGMTELSTGLFQNAVSLKELTIPETVTTIGDQVFQGCESLTSVYIPSDLTDIVIYNEFSHCPNLVSIEINAANTAYSSVNGVVFDKDGKTLIYCPNGIDEYSIPDGITCIGKYAFSGCTDLDELIIPDSVTSIEMYAFSHCSSLTQMRVPDTVTELGSWAFNGCSSLKTISLSNMTTLGRDLFNSCDALTDIYYSGTISEWYDTEAQPFIDNDVVTVHYNTAAPDTTIPVSSVMGDTNLDGEVTILDVIKLNKNLLSGEPLEEQGILNADVDGDSTPTVTDAMNILKYVIKLIDTFSA